MGLCGVVSAPTNRRSYSLTHQRFSCGAAARARCPRSDLHQHAGSGASGRSPDPARTFSSLTLSAPQRLRCRSPTRLGRLKPLARAGALPRPESTRPRDDHANSYVLGMNSIASISWTQVIVCATLTHCWCCTSTSIDRDNRYGTRNG